MRGRYTARGRKCGLREGVEGGKEERCACQVTL